MYVISSYLFNLLFFDFRTTKSMYIKEGCPVPDLPIGAIGLKPRASKFRGSPAKVYNIFNTVIGLFHSCCHKVVYFLNNPSVIFLTQLHSISENCRILNTPYHLRLYSNWLNTLPSSSSREGGELGGASQVE